MSLGAVAEPLNEKQLANLRTQYDGYIVYTTAADHSELVKRLLTTIAARDAEIATLRADGWQSADVAAKAEIARLLDLFGTAEARARSYATTKVEYASRQRVAQLEEALRTISAMAEPHAMRDDGNPDNVYARIEDECSLVLVP